MIIKRDGVEVARVDDPTMSDRGVLTWFMRHTSNSMAYAVKYDGYTVEDEDGNEIIGKEYARGYSVK